MCHDAFIAVSIRPSTPVDGVLRPSTVDGVLWPSTAATRRVTVVDGRNTPSTATHEISIVNMALYKSAGTRVQADAEINKLMQPIQVSREILLYAQ